MQHRGRHAMTDRNPALAKLVAGHGRNGAPDSRVTKRALQIRESRPVGPRQRRHGTVYVVEIIYVDDVPNVDAVEPAAVPASPSSTPTPSSPPREERIAGSDRKPADGTESESDAESESEPEAAEAEKVNVCRRPDRSVPAAESDDRPRPPSPGIVIEEPATVVVRCPTPRLRRHPGVTPIGLPNPRTVGIRCPAGRLRGLPHVAVAGNVVPVAVGVKVLAARVVGVGVPPALCIQDGPVAICVPAVPFVTSLCLINLILRIVRALDGDSLALRHVGAALGRGHLRLALPHGQVGLGRRAHLDAVDTPAE